MRIYTIKNKQSGKQYVGQTRTSLNKRFSSHFTAAKRGSTGLLHDAMRTLPKDSFQIELLQACRSIDELDEAERKWIAELRTIAPDGYNIEEGGCRFRGALAGSTRAKLREAAKHRPPEWYARICHAARNRSPEWRRKLSEAIKQRKVTPKQREALAAGARLRHINGTTKGEHNGRAILTWDKVFQIREMYATGNYSQDHIGLLFGVKQITISAIVRHKIWRINTQTG